ncbi:hypothetical protein Tco_0497884 [Tanacetum coccineum]
MDQENLQQAALDEALVPIVDQVKIGSCSMRIDLLKTHTCSSSVPNQEFVEPPPHDALVSFVKQPGYKGAMELVSESRQSSAKRREQMPYPRFTKVIIHHFLSKHNSLPKRHSSFINTIKYDFVLGKLKFVNKGEKHQKNGMSIPDSMMNDKIRSSVPYQTYLALSTGTKVQILKVGKGGKGKRLMGKKKPDTGVQQEEKKNATTLRKKSSITADDNIIPDPNEALKLEIPNEKTKDAFDHSKKLKRMETLPAAAKLVSDLKTATKASKLDYKIQQQSIGSSEGYGIVPEVPNEPKDISGNSRSSRSGSDDETKDISSNDEIKADEIKSEEGKAIEEQSGEEPPVDE